LKSNMKPILSCAADPSRRSGVAKPGQKGEDGGFCRRQPELDASQDHFLGFFFLPYMLITSSLFFLRGFGAFAKRFCRRRTLGAGLPHLLA
jgi:hypothetical protein